MDVTQVSKSEFERVGEVEVDSRRRISLARLVDVAEHARYFVNTRPDGEILLVPAKSIPAREALLWENPMLLASLHRGMEQAALGKLEDHGSFAGHLNEGDDDTKGRERS